MVASLFAFSGILRFVVRRREKKPSFNLMVAVALFVIVGGMYFTRWGQNFNLPCWVYYTVPMLATVVVVPLVLRLRGTEFVYL